MKNKQLGRLFAMTMAMALTVTSAPLSVRAEEEAPEGSVAEAAAEPAEGEGADKSDDGQYSLVWEDEFDGETLNTNDWNVEQHEPGWVNKEKQRYTAIDEGNIEVHDGMLHIISKYEETEVEDAEGESEDQGEANYDSVEFSTYGFDFDMGGESSTTTLQLNFGKVDGEFGEAAATVLIDSVSLKDITDGGEGVEVLKNSDLDSSDGERPDGWELGITDPAKGEYSVTDGVLKIKIDECGSENWHVQFQQKDFELIPGHKYHFEMSAVADNNRTVQVNAMDYSNWGWFGGTGLTVNGIGELSEASGSAKTVKGEITSGRITTQNLHDFTYGRFEARAKVPASKGLLPAFWLMATDEGLYGQWPKCGEIDIMEVMGQNTSKSYHTIHYGYSQDTHKENQGTKVIDENGFSNDFHDFRVDWEPGLITWYVDGEQVYQTNDWHTGTDDDNQITYPAPFDQNFYIILNLAVGGSWVGYPDDYHDIDGEEFVVDYVRVYQKDEASYSQGEEVATRPEKEPVQYREPVDGNYLLNADFSAPVDEDKDNNSSKNWVIHLQDDAEGSTAETADGAVTITPSTVGELSYSVQLKQAGIPMYKGWEYELSFDAYSTENRSIVVDVSAPDRNWSRYLADTTVNITPENKNYTLDFTINDKTDPNGSLEFNLGALGSTAPVTISNVKLVHKSGEEIQETNEKTIRPDGNYVYNGSFDQGDKRLGYWEVEEEDKDNVSVTNTKNKRELMVKVEVPEGTSETNPVTIAQSDLAPLVSGEYDFSFSAYTTDGEKDGLTATVAGKTFTPELTNEKKNFSNVLVVDNDLTREETGVEFTFTKPGTYFLDDVFLAEKSLLKNGSFNAGMTAFKVYVNEAAKASSVIDSMNGNSNTFAMKIDNTGDAGNDWYIQLNQDDIKLQKDKYYKVAFRAKSSIERKIKYSVGHNGETDNDWSTYDGAFVETVNGDWKEFTSAFQMPKDDAARFNITMGSVDGVQITDQHDVYIDDISLVEITKEEFDKLNGNEAPAPAPSETPAEEPAETPSEEKTSEVAPTEEKTSEAVPAQEKASEVAPSENKSEEAAQQPAPTVETKKNEPAKVQSKSNNNGKAEKGEVKASKNKVYKVTGKGEASFKPNTGSKKKIFTVPSTVVIDGAKVKVTKIAKNAFKGNKKVKNVTIGKNVTTIGKNAFNGCENLKKITVKGDNLTKIDKSAFKNCKHDEDFIVVIYASNDENFVRIAKLFEEAGLTGVTFVRK
ncbi:carbohydrate binding domain-containing protein [Butyrivibrio sp. INlla16]|uniref:carbohydrate binding domain-containing protein n=1 Tax=Butyrivibrio sp. INlla16 TaxID=1520807 RepID=UPI00087FE8C3|nr:carbohydrate binding domain-containing protein [Butyrivibrio sp. INlla16]SDB02628.1 Carbohydrate binding domain-containing protein [Butyrivibrio sp. INlla16]